MICATIRCPIFPTAYHPSGCLIVHSSNLDNHYRNLPQKIKPASQEGFFLFYFSSYLKIKPYFNMIQIVIPFSLSRSFILFVGKDTNKWWNHQIKNIFSSCPLSSFSMPLVFWMTLQRYGFSKYSSKTMIHAHRGCRVVYPVLILC